MKTRTRRFLGTGARSLESISIGAGVVAFVVAALAAFIRFGISETPISGPGSVGQFAAISSAIAALVVFAFGRYVVRSRAPERPVHVLNIVDVVALAFAHGVIALLGWTLVADIMSRGFVDAMVFPLAVVVLAGAATAVTAYAVMYSALHMNMSLLAIVLATFLVFGVVASMLAASDPHWWQTNLSALGMTDDFSALAFNLTLIVAGIIVTTLARYSTHRIPTDHPKGITRVRVCLVIVGLFLGLVGVFPVDQFFALHTGVASGMAVAFALLVFSLRRWVPGIPNTFHLMGYAFVAVIVLLAVFFFIGYYTLTAVELVAGVLIFAWIIVFIRNADALARDTHEEPGPQVRDVVASSN